METKCTLGVSEADAGPNYVVTDIAAVNIATELLLTDDISLPAQHILRIHPHHLLIDPNSISLLSSTFSI